MNIGDIDVLAGDGWGALALDVDEKSWTPGELTYAAVELLSVALVPLDRADCESMLTAIVRELRARHAWSTETCLGQPVCRCGSQNGPCAKGDVFYCGSCDRPLSARQQENYERLFPSLGGGKTSRAGWITAFTSPPVHIASSETN